MLSTGFPAASAKSALSSKALPPPPSVVTVVSEQRISFMPKDKSSSAGPKLAANAQAVYNSLVDRYTWINRLLDSRHNVDAECGHPLVITMADYDDGFQRRDVAGRVICIYPDETWGQNPEIFETEDIDETPFETAWRDLDMELGVLSHLHRIDVLSGIGRYGILLLGFDDGRLLNEPLPDSGQHQLLYLRPLDESVVNIKEFERDTRNPRYGLPTQYEVSFSDADNAFGQAVNSTKQLVHWSRVIHVADNRTNSEVFGIPRMKRVFNRLLDLRKITGGAGEMFWKGGFPGLSIESHPNITDDIEFDADATKEQMEAYMQGLQRYIATVGMTVRSLEVQVADPRPHVETQLRLIATAMAVPWRIFVGSESAHLASSQDEQTWNRRLTHRRNHYVTPHLIRPFVKRLIGAGVLPAPAENKFQVWWPDLNTPSEEARSQNAERLSNAMSKYIQAGADALVPPFFFLTEILGLEADEAQAIIAAAEAQDVLLSDSVNVEEDPTAAPRSPARNGALP